MLIAELVLLIILLGLSALLTGLLIAFNNINYSSIKLLLLGGTSEERIQAKMILFFENKMHFLFCSLLIASTLVNETMPVFLKPIMGGSIKAVVGSSLLILVFGEIIPQCLFSKHNIYMCSKLSKFVRLVMCIFSPLSYPTSLLIEKIVGKENENETMDNTKLKALINLNQKSLHQKQYNVIDNILSVGNKLAMEIMKPTSQLFKIDINSKVDKYTIMRIKNEKLGYVLVYKNNHENIVGYLDTSDFIGVCVGTDVCNLHINNLHNIQSTKNIFEICSLMDSSFLSLVSVSHSVYDRLSIGIIHRNDINYIFLKTNNNNNLERNYSSDESETGETQPMFHPQTILENSSKTMHSMSSIETLNEIKYNQNKQLSNNIVANKNYNATRYAKNSIEITSNTII